MPESAKKILKNQKYLTSSLNRVYKDRKTGKERVNVSARKVIYNRKFGLVITSEEIKEFEVYERKKLKDIYSLLEL